jgi:6-pyruvoyltetrahydropterin/6-carboxytetrahydropterin synthase
MNKQRLSLHIERNDIGFSAAHFTIFSPFEREKLHGHNFNVGLEVVAISEKDGMIFDYRILKSRLRLICSKLDESILLPTNSPHLIVNNDGDSIRCLFGSDLFVFPFRDVVLMDVSNITLESLSQWFADTMIASEDFPVGLISELSISVASSRGQCSKRRIFLS